MGHHQATQYSKTQVCMPQIVIICEVVNLQEQCFPLLILHQIKLKTIKYGIFLEMEQHNGMIFIKINTLHLHVTVG
jgi:hypothetical protein